MNKPSFQHRTALLFDIVLVAVGLTLLSLGIAVCVSTPWGTQPWDVLHLSLARITGLSLGRISQFVSALVVATTLLLRGKGVTWLTVVNALVLGFQTDLFLRYVPFVDGAQGLLYLEFGVVLVGLGMAFYLAPGWGAGPRDSLMLVLHERTGWPVSVIRMGLDLGVVAAGALLGGPLGVGTVLTACTTGPWAQTFLRLTRLTRARILQAGAAPAPPH